MTCRNLGAALALALSLTSAGASADPSTDVSHIKSPSHLVSDGGTDLRLPPGYFVPEPTWLKIDTEVRRLQDAETRLGAENKSLRDSANAGPGWGTVLLIGSALVAGFTAREFLH